jgi:hypothetical protein
MLQINPAMSGTKAIMRIRKLTWEHHALPTRFTEHKYPNDSSYLTINKSMMDHKKLNLGYPTISRP